MQEFKSDFDRVARTSATQGIVLGYCMAVWNRGRRLAAESKS